MARWLFWPAEVSESVFNFELRRSYFFRGGTFSGDGLNSVQSRNEITFYWQQTLGVTSSPIPPLNFSQAITVGDLDPDGNGLVSFDIIEFSHDFILPAPTLDNVSESPFPFEQQAFSFSGDGWVGVKLNPRILEFTDNNGSRGEGNVEDRVTFTDYSPIVWASSRAEINFSDSKTCEHRASDSNGNLPSPSPIDCNSFPITWYRTEDLRQLI